jgi:hypothetical protein
MDLLNYNDINKVKQFALTACSEYLADNENNWNNQDIQVELLS